MLTPQEVSEHAFAKASFGGYNMAMVDEFLDQLTEDYTALYKENAALKSKMKVLVEKVEEYRSTEEAMRKALLTAQQMADQMVRDAEQKKEELVGQAETEAKERVLELRRQAEAEQLRLTSAQTAAAAYLDKLKGLCQQGIDYLNSLNDIVPPEPKADPAALAAQDIEVAMQRIMAEEAAKAAEAKEGDTKELPTVGGDGAQEPGGLYQDLTSGRKPKEDEDEDDEEEPTRRIDLEHLQFGKDYEIK